MEQIQKFISDNRKIIITIVVLIILFILWKKYGYLLMRLLKPPVANNTPEALTEIRKNEIEKTMGEIDQDIEHTPLWGHDYAPYERFLGYYDNEIIYGADYYKNFLANGVSLYKNLDTQWFITGDVNLRVLDKLKELGKQ